jgi:hypothetical protein
MFIRGEVSTRPTFRYRWLVQRSLLLFARLMSPLTFPLFRSAAKPPNEEGGGLAFDLAKNGTIPPGKREAFQIRDARLVPSELTTAITQPEQVDSTQVKTADRGLGVHRLVTPVYKRCKGRVRTIPCPNRQECRFPRHALP